MISKIVVAAGLSCPPLALRPLMPLNTVLCSRLPNNNLLIVIHQTTLAVVAGLLTPTITTPLRVLFQEKLTHTLPARVREERLAKSRSIHQCSRPRQVTQVAEDGRAMPTKTSPPTTGNNSSLT